MRTLSSLCLMAHVEVREFLVHVDRCAYSATINKDLSHPYHSDKFNV